MIPLLLIIQLRVRLMIGGGPRHFGRNNSKHARLRFPTTLSSVEEIGNTGGPPPSINATFTKCGVFFGGGGEQEDVYDMRHPHPFIHDFFHDMTDSYDTTSACCVNLSSNA